MPVEPTIFGTMYINYRSGGWSERYAIKDATTAGEALLTMQAIVYGRSAFLATGCEIVYARCSIAGPGRDRRVCDLPYPIGPHPIFAGVAPSGPNTAPNDRGTAVQMYVETSVGQWGNRYIRCIPDGWVSNMVLAVGMRPYFQMASVTPTEAELGPAGGPSHLAVCQGFWAYLKAKTSLPHKNSAIDYTQRTVANVGFAQVTTKKMGRPFRPPVGRRASLTVR